MLAGEAKEATEFDFTDTDTHNPAFVAATFARYAGKMGSKEPLDRDCVEDELAYLYSDWLHTSCAKVWWYPSLDAMISDSILTRQSLLSAPEALEEASHRQVGAYEYQNVEEVFPQLAPNCAPAWANLTPAVNRSHLRKIQTLDVQGACAAMRVAIHVYARHAGITYTPSESHLIDSLDVLCSAGWVYFGDKAPVVVERPVVARLDELARPHCIDGPCYIFRDGTERYGIGGKGIPAEVFYSSDRDALARYLGEDDISAFIATRRNTALAKKLTVLGAPADSPLRQPATSPAASLPAVAAVAAATLPSVPARA